MKNIYRKINTNLVNKMVNNTWRGATEYNKNVKKGIQLEGGSKDTLCEIIKYEFVLSKHGIPFETIVEYNPYKFKNVWLNAGKLADEKVSVSDKCLYAYAYRGKYLEPYYENGLLDKEAVENKINSSNMKIDLSTSIKEEQLENGFENAKVLEIPELVSVFKGSRNVWISEESRQIFLSTQYIGYGYEVENMWLRYGVYLFDESKWIDDKQVVEATHAKLKTIQKLSNGPEQFDVESYLMWIGGQTSKKYVDDYLKLLYQVKIGGIKWHQECEQRMKNLGIDNKYNGYKVYVFEEFVDPIQEDYSLKLINKKYSIGHDYENDEDMIGLYDPVYKDDSQEEK